MRHKFTLIELLIVIAIIAILAAILLPALNKARSRAVALECMTRLSQLGKCFHMYANDHEGFFPQINFNGSSNAQWYFILVGKGKPVTAPYVNSNSIRCPDMSIAEELRVYGGNYQNGFYFNIKKCYHPSQLAILFDWNHIGGNRATNQWDRVWNMEEPAIFRHQRRMNILYCDSHVGNLTYAALQEKKQYLFANKP